MDVMEKLAQVNYLETRRLNLRRFMIKDASTVFEYASDEVAVRYLTFPRHRSVEESKELIREHLHKPGYFLIEKKETLEGIGAISLNIDIPNNKASFAFALVRREWSKGYASEALIALLKLAFEYLELNRVEALHAVQNTASGIVMKKCGLLYEGTFRQSELWHGEYFDVHQMAILRSDWIRLHP